MLNKKATILIALMLIIALFAGCTAQAPISGTVSANPVSDTGTIILRVNPEIAVHYNRAGLVTSLAGLNADGEAIVNGYADYIGKDARIVLQDLVENINEAGYFVSKVDGSTRNITIEIEPGSVLPQSDYMNVLAKDVQDTVQRMNKPAETTGIGPDAYDDTNAQNAAPEASTPSVSGDDRNDQNASQATSTPAATQPQATTRPSGGTSGNSGYSTPRPATTARPSSGTTGTRGDSGYSNYGDSGYSNSGGSTTIIVPRGNSGYSNYDDSGYSSSNSNSGYSSYSGNSGYSNYSGNSGYS